jgi:hypothetical protein
MSIENRNLKVGTKLTATYRKQDFTCKVVRSADGLRYRLADGQEFKSLCAAGAAIFGKGPHLQRLGVLKLGQRGRASQ